jgi:hypothetical protein
MLKSRRFKNYVASTHAQALHDTELSAVRTGDTDLSESSFTIFTTLLASFFLFGLAQMLQGTTYNFLGDLMLRKLRGKVILCGQFLIYTRQAFARFLGGALYTYVSPRLPFIPLAVGVTPLSFIAIPEITAQRQRSLRFRIGI